MSDSFEPSCIQANSVAFTVRSITQYFFAVFPDGREERLTGITMSNGETLEDAVEKLRAELGAPKIIMKPLA